MEKTHAKYSNKDFLVTARETIVPEIISVDIKCIPTGKEITIAVIKNMETLCVNSLTNYMKRELGMLDE